MSKKHACPICGKFFPRQSSVKRHVEGIHQKIQRFACQFHCGYKSSEKCNVKRHESKCLARASQTSSTSSTMSSSSPSTGPTFQQLEQALSAKGLYPSKRIDDYETDDEDSYANATKHIPHCRTMRSYPGPTSTKTGQVIPTTHCKAAVGSGSYQWHHPSSTSPFISKPYTTHGPHPDNGYQPSYFYPPYQTPLYSPQMQFGSSYAPYLIDAGPQSGCKPKPVIGFRPVHSPSTKSKSLPIQKQDMSSPAYDIMNDDEYADESLPSSSESEIEAEENYQKHVSDHVDEGQTDPDATDSDDEDELARRISSSTSTRSLERQQIPWSVFPAIDAEDFRRAFAFTASQTT